MAETGGSEKQIEGGEAGGGQGGPAVRTSAGEALCCPGGGGELQAVCTLFSSPESGASVPLSFSKGGLIFQKEPSQ